MSPLGKRRARSPERYSRLPGLLEKYSTEAVLTGAAASTNHNKEEAYANEMLQPETQPSFLAKKGKRFFYKGVLIQVTGFSIVH